MLQYLISNNENMSLFDRMMEKNVKRAQGLQDGMLDRTVSRAKSMQKKMLDMQEEIYERLFIAPPHKIIYNPYTRPSMLIF